MGLCCISLLQTNLLDVVEPLVWVHEDAGVARLLLFALHLGFEALAEMTVLTELVEEMQISAILVVIIEYCVLILEAARSETVGGTLAPVHVDE